MTRGDLKTLTVGYDYISYDVHGQRDSGLPALILLTGWCQDERLFDHIVAELSRKYLVVRMNWRGHTDTSEAIIKDFGVQEQADDIAKLMDALDLPRVIPISTSHGGWANLQFCDMAGTARVPGCVLIDMIMTEPDDSLRTSCEAGTNPATWEAACRQLFEHWVGETDNPIVRHHVRAEMGAFGFDMWARSFRVIRDAYAAWGSPMKRMLDMNAKRPLVHIYSQSPSADYEDVQARFGKQNDWFSFVKIPGGTHFPTLESPMAMAAAIDKFCGQFQAQG